MRIDKLYSIFTADEPEELDDEGLEENPDEEDEEEEETEEEEA